MNLNKLAKLISEMEHGKVQVNIAQIKEVLKCMVIIDAARVYALQHGSKQCVRNATLDSDELRFSLMDFERKHAKEISDLAFDLYAPTKSKGKKKCKKKLK